jgi:hypothetical protein
MAKTKKKSDVIDIKQTDVLDIDWPKVVKGSHLTVITHKNGRTELVWDDAALLRDVRAALLKAESTVAVATEMPKRSKKTKTK